jgi:hypothetical protein
MSKSGTLASALHHLQSRGLRSVRLDATALGRPVYEKLGFVAEFPVIRFAGTFGPAPEACSAAESVSPGCWEELFQFDQQVTQTDRSKMLRRLFVEHPEMLRLVRQNGRLAGYLAARPGSAALQLGPCLASAGAGPELLADAGVRFAARPVLMDIPGTNQHAMDHAVRLGLAPSRNLTRMRWGEPIPESLDQIWAGAGLEKG